MRTCQVVYAIDPDGNKTCCGLPADIQLISGCIHEHISTDDVCTDHAHAVQRDELVCTWCRFGPDPHYCRIISREVVL